jgi:hypothetical protein
VITKEQIFKLDFAAVNDCVPDSKLMVLTNEAWFHLSGHISTQKSRYWSRINLRQTFEVPLDDWKIGVWCAIIDLLDSIVFK